MLRHKTKLRPGLVALYDIRPGNGAGLFLQPRSGACTGRAWCKIQYHASLFISSYSIKDPACFPARLDETNKHNH